ncbi:MAG TPA: hypothetical protein EYP55_11245 [Anaerolineae bacterium]|nr:hypothetical protein [Anaerolineae bacterium]
MAKVEGILEQMNARLNHLETEMADMRKEISGEISQLRSEISQLRAELQTNFRWLIGFVVGTWITIMLTLLFGR